MIKSSALVVRNGIPGWFEEANFAINMPGSIAASKLFKSLIKRYRELLLVGNACTCTNEQ